MSEDRRLAAAFIHHTSGLSQVQSVQLAKILTDDEIGAVLLIKKKAEQDLQALSESWVARLKAQHEAEVAAAT